MPDTQLPRFMVFQREAKGQPLVHNGTVHAPDIELALLNARDVFVRRPEATELWVVPVESIVSKTREELVAAEIHKTNRSVNRLIEFCVFGKLAEQAQATQLGEVEAASHEDALDLAVSRWADRGVLRWWIFPKRDALTSEPQDASPMFGPAREKKFKDQAEYPVVTMMRQLRSKGKLDSE